MTCTRAVLRAIATYLPAGRLTNAELAQQFPDWPAEKILAKTGIAERPIASPEECSSDLGVAAAEALFRRGSCSRDEIDFLIFCTQSPDYFLPATACVVQDRLGLRTACGALDINQGCSGFVYGLALAKSLVEAETAARVLLITAETYSKFIHPLDKSVRTVFGDGAAATLVSAFEGDHEMIGSFVLGTDGRGAPNLIVPAGGMRRPMSAENGVALERESGNWRSEQNLFMNGPEIFNFTLATIPQVVRTVLERWGRALDDVDLFVFHQANRFMLEHLRAKLRLPAEKFWLDMEHVGNTVSSTIPIALESALAAGRIGPGSRVMLVGFGVGYSWAACMVTFT